MSLSNENLSEEPVESKDKKNGQLTATNGTSRMENLLVQLGENIPKSLLNFLLTTVMVFRVSSGEHYLLVAEKERFFYKLLNSEAGKRLLIRHLVYLGRPVNELIIRKLIKELNFSASCGEELKLYNRFTRNGQDLLIDMTNGRQIRISSSEVKVEPYDYPRFLSHPVLLPIEDPILGGDPLALFREMFSGLSEDNLLLLIASCSAALDAGISKPMICFIGAPGSGKTTICRWVISIVDPSRTPTLGEFSKNNLVQIFASRSVCAFDNVAKISPAIADEFCRAVTGAQVERRKLFTDNTPFLFEYRPWILMNGIELPTVQTDFLDRAIVFEFERHEEFESLEKLDEQFEELLSQLRGALYELTAKALKLRESSSAQGGKRLADFAWHGRAVARALGKTEEDFDRAYDRNLGVALQTKAEELPWLPLLREIASAYCNDDADCFQPEELLEQLRNRAQRSGQPESSFKLPKNGSWLSRRLKSYEDPLKRIGIGVHFPDPTSNGRGIRVFLLGE